jgi:hypothetical protein
MAAAAVAAMLLASGCQVSTNKNGDSKDVKIQTPFGGLHVTTNESAVLEQIGLAAYPGATPAKKENDDGAADVNLTFGDYRLRVKAASYRTTDAPDKVEAFYRDQLKRYGDVIECRNSAPVGTPVKTFEGLTCANETEGRISFNDVATKNGFELKTGSRQHQRVVTIAQEGSGTKFGLVVLDLPKGVNGNVEDGGGK